MQTKNQDSIPLTSKVLLLTAYRFPKLRAGNIKHSDTEK